MAPSRMVGGLSQTSGSSGIFFQGDSQSHLSPSFGNTANSISGTGRLNHLGQVSGDVNHTVLNGVANSGPSVGASSLVTDANSGFSGGPQLQRSASINTESYLRLPASPMSFTSNNNVSISGSSIIDGPSTGHPGSHHDPNSQQQAIQSQHHFPQGASSLQGSQTGQLPHPLGSRIPNSFIQDPANTSHLQKKPRLDIKQEDIFQQQVLHQLLQRQDPMQMQNHNSQLQAIFQHQRMRQQQQMYQSMPPLQRAQLQQQQQQHQQQQQQQQLRQQLQQNFQQQITASMKHPYDTGGVCARRLMQYLYHQRQRPQENTIAYWRKFVAEYYAPRAKKRWCLSLYENVGQHALGVFPQASMDAWHCDICGSKSGRGFEATYEVLPRLNEIKFGSGVIDELLFVDVPRERRFGNGIMMLEYGKAVQESVYEQLRVVREGQLRIIFTQELKILSWDFCARRHEELLPRRLVAPQVNQLLQVAQKCQSTLAESGPDGVSSQDLQTNSNMVVTAGRQLAKSLELQSLNDLGFSKRYVRCLQIAEVVNSMKDLVDFCRDNKVGPIEGLKSYPRHSSASKLQMQRIQEMEQLAGSQGLPTDRNTINKLMAMQQQPGMNHPNPNLGNNNNTNLLANNNRGSISGQAAAALALTNYQNMMIRQNSMNSNPNSLQQEQPSSSQNNNQSPSSSFQGGGGSSSVLPGSIQNFPGGGGFSSNQQFVAQQNQQQQQPSQPGNQALQQHVIQQLLQDMSGNNAATGQQKTLSGGQTMNPSAASSGLGYGNNGTPVTPAVSSNVPGGGGGGAGPTLSKSNSFKAPTNSDSSAAGGGSNGGFNGGSNGGFNQKASEIQQNLHQKVSEIQQNLHLSDDMVPDLPHDFSDTGFFGSDLDDNIGYGWKA
ncbi:probable transcriptional regulator SLK2 [Spinacia oleracea]|uniref:Probable transcriptional regulator SLK2 n=1 Tax=Spinacia oleracea TaxID=3562 RepID=A0A9R0I4X7_SPIOL|nr:probable transcriptional regulator SLK2 [Spinacia oleracea]XP_021842330.2 probable transcriptional regulator SLK2 [Spinacia oleracea]